MENKMETPDSPTEVERIIPKQGTVIPCIAISDSDDDKSVINTGSKQKTGSNIPIVDITETNIEPETACVRVLFMNTDVGRKYRHEIEKFFQSLMKAESLSKSEPLPKIQPRPNLKCSDENGENMSPAAREQAMIIGSMEVYQVYMLDRLGWPMIANMLNQTPGIDVPQYIQVFMDPYPPPEDEAIVNATYIKTSKKCFNCGADGHEIAKCDKPFDRETFRRNKIKFLSSGLQYGRYHKGDGSSRSGKPGQISDELRHALGLKDDELPAHIYQMRRMGYPPGWLLDAEVDSSGLAMFDKTGREVDLDGDMMEDGQVPEHRIRDVTNLKYDASRLIAFPGFNAEIPSDIVDYAATNRRYPPMNPDHHLEVMSSKINIVDTEPGIRKRPRYDSESTQAKRSKPGYDMELSDDDDDNIIEVIEYNPPLPETESAEGQPEQPPEPAEETTSVLDIDACLDELEKEKQTLLAELADMESNQNSTPLARKHVPSHTSSQSPVPVMSLDETPQTSHQSLCYQITTPIPKHSDVDKLPAYENFSSGITEHLPYENLPGATGVYEKLITGVIKEVREQMKSMKTKGTRKK